MTRAAARSMPTARPRRDQRGGILARLVALLAFLALFLFAYEIRHPLFRVAASMLIVSERPQPSDAIVILGDDNFQGDRARRAAEIFRGGWAPRIVCSGRYLRPYATVAQLEERDLLSDGVPKSAIVPFSNYGLNTGEEAASVARFAADHGWKRLIVVTSDYHTRRARYIYRHILPPGDELRVIAAPDSDFDLKHWWQSYLGRSRFAHEAAGYWAAVWGIHHHAWSNPPPAPSAAAPTASAAP